MTHRTTHLRGGALTAAGLALLTALTACGSGGAAEDTDDAAATGETVTVETDYGPVEIPAEPRSVVALEFGNEVLLEAGIAPAGAIEPGPGLYTEEQLGILEQVPVVQATDLTINLEAVATAEPDLIIGGVREQSHADFEAHKADLEEIAPTVLFDFEGAGDGLREMSLELAGVVGDGERAAQDKAAFEERSAEIARTYAEQLEDTTFAVVFAVEGQLAVVNSNAWGAYTLDSLGAGLTSAVEPAGDEFAAWYSLEEIDVLNDADVVFYETDVTLEADPVTEELLGNELWATLPAAREDRVFPLRYSFSRTYGQADDVLDQVEAVLQDL
ncbi:ABC transporter substrate-binding protein [Nocardiopsis flavescens]|uniref:Iron complex transport system substrate-binding protein n=1 Tax=Nocardiopsis flavescens TaxID=758803 RepID=A0A1M6J6L2_9ACTN|nr:ABC transporter substrate-binding protein [Nocardiopsis flavescens]SHJ42309.1 iron complex transport system substrate-binding protein [Nocardiopsis flavescens]